MPDLVEQSRDANERACWRGGLQTTVAVGLNSAFRECFLLWFPTEAPKYRNGICIPSGVKKNLNERYDCFYICLNDIRFPRKMNGWKQTFDLHQNRPLFQRM